RRWDSNALLGQTELGAACEHRYRAPYVTVLREELYRILRREAESLRSVTLRTGVACTGLFEHADAVELYLDDGSSTVADVVVGADGVHSVVRSHLVTDVPVYTGVTVYRGLIPADRVPWLRRAPKVMVWLGPGQHCVAYPVGTDKVNLVAA